MKKVTVKNKSGEIIAIQIMEDPSEWLAENIQSCSWGQPERWQMEYKRYESPAFVKPYNQEDVIAEEDREWNGEIKHYVKLRSDYNIEVVDISWEYSLESAIRKRLAEYPSPEDFLNAFFDGGDAAIQELKEKRLAIKNKYPKPVKVDDAS